MVVATTVSLAERAQRFEVARGEQKDGVAVDDFAVAIGEEGAVGVAVEGDAHGGFALEDFGGDDFGMERAATGVDVAAVGGDVGEDDLAATVGVEFGEELRRDGARGAVGAVDDDAAAIEREARDGVEQEADVLGAVGLVYGGRGGVGGCVGGGAEPAEDLFLDGEFGGVGQLVAVGAEELDAVVLPGIVRGGDDDAGSEAMGAGEEGDGGGGDDAGAFDESTTRGEAGGEGGGDPVGGFARVLPDQDARLFCSDGAKVMRDGDAHGVDGCRIEGALPGNAADAVGTKQLFHSVYVSAPIIPRAEVEVHGAIGGSADRASQRS